MAKKFELFSVNYTEAQAIAVADLSAGDFVKSGDTNGFPIIDVLDTKQYTLITKAEKVKAEKAAVVIVGGQKLYWDDAAGKVTNIEGALAIIGEAYEAAESADTHLFMIFDGALVLVPVELKAVIATPAPLTMLTGTVSVILTNTGGIYAPDIAIGDLIITGTDAPALYAGTLVRTSDTVVTITVASGNVGTDNIIIVPSTAQETQATSIAVTQA